MDKDTIENFRTVNRQLEAQNKRIKDLEKLINKRPTTTNEQPKMPTDLRIELMKVMSKHTDLRNSDKLTNTELYHAFLDWEKEMWKLL